MATKNTISKRPVSRAEAEKIKTKYYALKKVLYDISKDTKYTDRARKLSERAYKKLEKWRSDTLELAKMTNYQAD